MADIKKGKPIRVVTHYPDLYIDKTDDFKARMEEANTFMVSLAVKHLKCSQEQIQEVLDKLTTTEEK
ncbi:MAG: hypothetical protein LIP12_14840 [Clostridiales bacterium]|nr:hypothetical protein [Clostridiales bacterium]